MEKTKKVPIGIEHFAEIRKEGFYYVDKTGLIMDLLNDWSQVNLFTRPRRFGKSLNMNMLKTFFEYGCDSRLFDGLKISKETALCETYMGRFPVLSITLKDAEAREFKEARAMLCSIIENEAMRLSFLATSDKLSADEKERYQGLIHMVNRSMDEKALPDAIIKGSLLTLSQLLRKHYGQQVILLIDEYDVPLSKAQQAGYYDEMIDLIRGLLSQTLKSNDNLHFAVLTGCLRIAKESIFTGLNNLKVYSVTDTRYNEHFGFLDQEVRAMLDYYGLTDKYELMKEWYDGYRFGNADVYCPWDVINYIDLLRSEPKARPRAFWINTSGNDIIRRFLQMAGPRTRREMERLVEGESISKKICLDLTYKDLYANIDNLWSVLFTTGYLTQRGPSDGDVYTLAIPNREIRQIFINQILEWFQTEARKDTPRLDAFCDASARGDAAAIEQYLGDYLQKTISIRDTSVRKDKKENLPKGKATTKGSKIQNPSVCFYHGILLGLLSHREDWDIDSNAESGDGFSDILVEIEDGMTGIVIEVKYPDDQNLEAGCEKALKQIEDLGYETRLRQDGMTRILKYGIACWKKRCKVQMG